MLEGNSGGRGDRDTHYIDCHDGFMDTYIHPNLFVQFFVCQLHCNEAAVKSK